MTKFYVNIYFNGYDYIVGEENHEIFTCKERAWLVAARSASLAVGEYVATASTGGVDVSNKEEIDRVAEALDAYKSGLQVGCPLETESWNEYLCWAYSENTVDALERSKQGA